MNISNNTILYPRIAPVHNELPVATRRDPHVFTTYFLIILVGMMGVCIIGLSVVHRRRTTNMRRQLNKQSGMAKVFKAAERSRKIQEKLEKAERKRKKELTKIRW